MSENRRRGDVSEHDGQEEEVRIRTPGGQVAGLLVRPARADRLLVLAHGAGAGMRHPFLSGLAGALAERGVATLRYQFPYMERTGWPPDRPHVLQETVRAAVREAAARAKGLPLLAGGKSLGGRMTSAAAAEGGLEVVRGLVLVGFPLHPAGRPGRTRADHLSDVDRPMLFLQGTRDRLADLDLLREVVGELGARATLHLVEGAGHGFAVPRASGRTEAQVRSELAAAVSAWEAPFLGIPTRQG